MALAAQGEQAFPGKGNLTAADEELRRLHAENQQLRPAAITSGDTGPLALHRSDAPPSSPRSRPSIKRSRLAMAVHGFTLSW